MRSQLQIKFLFDYNIDMLSVNGIMSLQNFAAGLGLQLSNINIPTRISNNKESLTDHYFSTNQQITSWKVGLPPFNIDHNVIFFQIEEKQNYFIKRDTKNLSMKNSIDIWLLQIGEQFINKETAMKCLQSLTEFFLTILEKNAPKEKKLVSNIKKDYFRKTLGDKRNSTFSCRETWLLQ